MLTPFFHAHADWGLWVLRHLVFRLFLAHPDVCTRDGQALPRYVVFTPPFAAASKLISAPAEELDVVFAVSTRQHAAYQLRQFVWWMRTHFLCQNVDAQPDLYDFSHLSLAQGNFNTGAPTAPDC